MATANWAHSRQGFLIHRKVALSAAGAACSRQGAAVCRMAKRLTARYLHPPQGEIIHREDEPSTASPRYPPQDLPMHREGSSSTARQGDLAQSPSIHRKAALSTARRLSLPQGGTTRREPPTAEGDEGAPPFSSQTGVRRGGINAFAAGRPPIRALLLGVALADAHFPGISLSNGEQRSWASVVVAAGCAIAVLDLWLRFLSLHVEAPALPSRKILSIAAWAFSRISGATATVPRRRSSSAGSGGNKVELWEPSEVPGSLGIHTLPVALPAANPDPP